MLDDSLLDDASRLVDTDTDGLLRMAALAGAQVRSVTETASEVGLDELGGDRPRALVLLARPGVAPAACHLLAALLGPSCPMPVVVVDTMPSWIGPLDVVLAHSDDPADPVMAESVALASRRGAALVLTLPPEGPVAAAVAGRARWLVPRIPVPAALSFSHVLTAGIAVTTALGLLRTETEALADEVDAEAAQCHPDREVATNPAKSLALRLADRSPLVWGVDRPATAVAEHAAFALGRHAGFPCDVADYAQAVTRHALHRAGASVGSETDLFADPEDTAGALLRVLLVSTRVDAAGERSAVAALPGADVLAPAESASEDVVVRSMILAIRIDFAALYLGLAAGAVGGSGPSALAAH
ncbi:hypothetical protein [Halosaccharopolyspora lacisalsi]|uniref:hypothetical protein n=1 Tax=Halosaccharopolyspora lacisalsi TaxID=1000566 RepID=UPI002E2C7217|nr:hypothetical protein [Halosaccharopolyspora lacisalsi]